MFIRVTATVLSGYDQRKPETFMLPHVEILSCCSLLFLHSDVDECLQAALSSTQICDDASMLCENTPGSFNCVCPGNTMFVDGECREPIGESVTCSLEQPEPPINVDTLKSGHLCVIRTLCFVPMQYKYCVFHSLKSGHISNQDTPKNVRILEGPLAESIGTYFTYVESVLITEMS